jgi:hypothetical protein
MVLGPHDVSIDYVHLWHDHRRERRQYKDLLRHAAILRKTTASVALPTSQEHDLLMMDLTAKLPQDKRIVKIFTSSTFTDTAHERNALMLDVYAYLRELCQRLALGFEVVDMRWGVPELVTNEHRSVELCEKEVLRCLQASASVAFVSLVGDKYGWRPFPRCIPFDEMAAMCDHLERAHVPQEELARVTRWFTLDENAVPSAYVVRSITHIYPKIGSRDPTKREQARQCWRTDAEALTETLRHGAQVLTPAQRWRYVFIVGVGHQPFTSCYGCSYYRSITEREVELGALTNPERNGQCLAFLRKIPILEAFQDDVNVSLTVLQRSRAACCCMQDITSAILQVAHCGA